MRRLLVLIALLAAPPTAAQDAPQQAPVPVLVETVLTVDGQPIQAPTMEMALQRRLRQAGFRPVRNPEQARAELLITAAARKNAEMMEIYSSYAELAVQLFDMAGGRELYAAAFDRERGLQLSYEEAGRLAVEHALSRFVEELLPEAATVAHAFYDDRAAVPPPRDTAPPEVVILEPAKTRGIKKRLREERVRIRGRVLDDSGIAEVRVNETVISLDATGGFTTEVAVADGLNPVVISAVDEHGNRGETQFDLPRARAASPVPGTYRALVVGIDSYDGVWTPLDNASRDAAAVAEVLRARYGFAEVTTLLNEDATRVRILQAFERLIRDTQPEDDVLIYYAGHGDYQERMRRGFWVPTDAETRSIIDFIPNSVIRDLVRGIPSRHTLLIADACFAGEVIRDEDRTGGAAVVGSLEEIRLTPSRIALTSGGVEPVMDGGVEGHSLFAWQLLETLRDADGPMAAVEVFEAVRGTVEERTLQTPAFSVIGEAGDEGGQFVFVPVR